MIFGVLFQLAILAGIGWGVVSLVKWGQSHGQTRQLSDPNQHARPMVSGPPPERSVTMEVDGRRGDSVPQSLTQALSPKATREQRMQELKRLYVDDEITVEQYEAELDKLMRD